ncbi:thermonuclease family protein [Nocardioides sp. CER19]|uniref:thermonuclease family protein n=1 Tax=Nocardioides sp. CER19 TaxID=3038538 RepID=UPI0024486EDA|nr:thermonuclease family protein [Nocardioides sp. CER19]MDH2415270.1 thermonuclease family protein [Nocardioides sp. CER19]
MRHVLGSLTALLLALSGATVLTAASPASAHTDKDCSDFATQADAQSYFISLGGPSSDPDRLDADGDGIACDSNPCPCSTNTGGGGGTAGTASHKSKKTTRRDYARVLRVVDGDTYDVRLHGHKVRIRVLGIDTPEVYGGVQCGGPQASARARHLLPRGTKVLLTSDTTQQLKDRYGRSLRYVSKSGKDIGKTLVRVGLARVYVYNHKPFKRTPAYKHTQATAKRAHRGIWGYC